MVLNPAPPHADPLGVPRPPAADAEELFHAYSAQLYRYCLGRLGSPEEAEDAVQVTYLNAWRSLRGGTHPADSRPWLFAIAANVCATALRTKLRGAKVEVRAPEDFERLPAIGAARDELVHLEAALKALPPRQLQALLLRDWRGLSYDEIATELDASSPAVETLLFRARRAVAASLETSAGRARSALGALVLWPSGLKSVTASLKSAPGNVASSFPGGAAAAKAAGLALAALTPLIAYGVFEGTHGPERAPASVHVTDSSSARLDAPGSDVRPPAARAAHPRTVAAARRASAALGGAAGPAAAGEIKSASSGGKTAGEPPAAEDHGASSGSGAEPSPAVEPAPDEESEDPGEAPQEAESGKVVICHHTGSTKHPDGTISVSASAVDAHLGHGDVLGACSG